MSKVRTSIMLDERILKTAKHRAVERGMSLSEVIEEALTQASAEGLGKFLDWAQTSVHRSADGRPLSRAEANER